MQSPGTRPGQARICTFICVATRAVSTHSRPPRKFHAPQTVASTFIEQRTWIRVEVAAGRGQKCAGTCSERLVQSRPPAAAAGAAWPERASTRSSSGASGLLDQATFQVDWARPFTGRDALPCRSSFLAGRAGGPPCDSCSGLTPPPHERREGLRPQRPGTGAGEAPVAAQ